MDHLMTKTTLAAALLVAMITCDSRADDTTPAATPPSAAGENEGTWALVESGAIAGSITLAPDGESQDVVRITGDGKPMRKMTLVYGISKTEKGTFLGVTTTAVPAALRAHTSLPKGFGLMVETIEKDSPAEEAGLEKYDVLQMLNDQLLVNQQQLLVLVRSMKPEESVAITLIRKGQRLTVNAVLVEKDVPELADHDVMGGGGAFTTELAYPTAIANWEGNGDPMAILKELGILDPKALNVVSSDGEQALELTSKNGGKHLVVKNKEDKVLFAGPIDTPDQRESLPEGVAVKLEKLQSKLHKITTTRANVQSSSDAPQTTEGKK